MSATTSVFRKSLCRAPSLRRHATRASSSKRTTLLPEKMRALVSLYHQADTFITPENLSDMIDYQFITRHANASVVRTDEDSFDMLQKQYWNRKVMPKIGETNFVDVSMDASSDGEEWSYQRSEREKRVIQALWGMQGRGRPDLEVLEEEAEKIKDMMKRDHPRQS